MAKRDYYEILGVSRNASADELKKAYRTLAMKYHPDRNPDDPESEARFKEAAEAYEVLRDPEKKARYDQFGHDGVNGNGFQNFNSAEDIFGAFSDIFGDFFGFGSRGGGPRPRSGVDLRYDMSISFREAAKGVEKEIEIPKREICDSCSGSGSEPGHSPETCEHCGGTGQVYRSQGFFRVSMPCPVCHGQGTIIKHPCAKCRGRGFLNVNKKINVRIPAGVDSGNRLRVRGEGEPGEHGGPPGDLYVVINVEEDKVFNRQGEDLLTQVEISMVQAALGDKIEVPTLDEPVNMEITKGVQSGESFRLKGLGLPRLGSTRRGDLHVIVQVKTPTKLSKQQEELLREFDKLEQKKTGHKVKNFFRKVMGE
ncbi:MAG: molecular chaperone DnaJ [Thermodesulfobacteriota bacterium]